MEELVTLIKTPFEIIQNAQGDAKIGYGFLMIVFMAGFVTLFYYILEFIQTIFRIFFNFLETMWTTFLGTFKKKVVHEKVDLSQIEFLIDKKLKDNTSEIHKILSEIKSQVTTKDIL